MAKLGLEREIVDRRVYDRTLARFREAGIRLPKIQELRDPPTHFERFPDVSSVSPDASDPANLFRVHWHNASDRRGFRAVPDHIVLPPELTGVDAPILVAVGQRFPMIEAHKVLAAYGCLVPRLVTGQFDPSHHRAVWPSTGNYCRGGVAISRILGCRGVAVLPEGMSRERFEWLERWVQDPNDIVRTPGTESNVKEIYDRCHELDSDPQNIIFNQFCEFGNHLVHYECTGRALAKIAETHELRPELFVSATGSAGTLGAGDFLKERFGTRVVAVEALECPTLLYNGYGEHNIQGIGDKHVPFIHNVFGTDFVVGVSDAQTDAMHVFFESPEGREHLSERCGVESGIIGSLELLGFSGIANVVAAIKVARYLGLSKDQAIVTVATDAASMYATETPKILRERFSGRFDRITAAEAFGEFWKSTTEDHVIELTHRDRERMFQLGYFTWVEQQGVSLADFDARRSPSFWSGLRDLVAHWDELVERFNSETGATAGTN